MTNDKLNILTLYKYSFESSPDYDTWCLGMLSYKTAGEYLPGWDRAYIDKYRLYTVLTHDQNVASKLMEKMIQRGENSWEYIGHVRDLVKGFYK